MDITETTITERTYIVWRTEIDIKDIANKEMWMTAFKTVNDYIQKNNIQYDGKGAALYFKWDTEKGRTDFAIGMPVTGVSEVTDPALSVVPVAESKASTTTVMGDYSKLMDAHKEMMQYVKENNINATLTIEEYVVTGMDAPESSNWVTNLYYLHQ